MMGGKFNCTQFEETSDMNTGDPTSTATPRAAEMDSAISLGLRHVEITNSDDPKLVLHHDLPFGLLTRDFYPERLFIGWLLYGDENDGASRVRALIPHIHLRRHGLNSAILRKPRIPWAPFEPSDRAMQQIIDAGLDVLIFQGVTGDRAEALASALQHTSTKTVYVTGDLVRSGMPAVVDWVVAGSQGLQDVARPYPEKTSVIEAALEAPAGLVKDYSQPPQNKHVRVVWVGYPENLHLLKPIREALQDPRLRNYQLVTISRGPEATIQWDRSRVWSELLECDIAVLPSAPADWYQAKPNTRMVMLKALGLPMIASPIESYRATLTHGRSCYFADSIQKWADYLAELGDAKRRGEIGLAGRDKIIELYSPQAISARWLSLLENLTQRETLSEGRAPKPS
jgi:glycosyltransferase involved in cell wall biosynthesis